MGLDAVWVILWLIALIISIVIIWNTIGNIGLYEMFPEGRRWWHNWTELGSLVIFAIVVLNHPF